MTSWTKKPEETAASYEAFRGYLGLEGRSLAALCVYLQRKPGYRRHLERWSSRYDWVARAAAHDAHRVEEIARIDEEARAATRAAHMKLRVEAEAKAHDLLPSAIETLGDLITGSEHDAVRLNAIKQVCAMTGLGQDDAPKARVELRLILPNRLRPEGAGDE